LIELDEVDTADCSKHSEQPQRTGGRSLLSLDVQGGPKKLTTFTNPH